ncbi:MAG: hypothetical protein AAGH82_11060 [Pseudomonadota bacterium]
MTICRALARGWQAATLISTAALLAGAIAIASTAGHAAAVGGLADEPVAMSLKQKITFFQRTCDRAVGSPTAIANACACVGTNLAMRYSEDEIAATTRLLKVSLNAGDAQHAPEYAEAEYVRSVAAGCGLVIAD